MNWEYAIPCIIVRLNKRIQSLFFFYTPAAREVFLFLFFFVNISTFLCCVLYGNLFGGRWVSPQTLFKPHYIIRRP